MSEPASGSTLALQTYGIRNPAPTAGFYRGEALIVLSNGKYAGIWLCDGNDAEQLYETMYIEWINADGSSDGGLELDVAYAHQYTALTLLETSDGGN